MQSDTQGSSLPTPRAAVSHSILTVEDDPVVRDSIAYWLEDAGFSVLQTDNGLTGLQIFRDEKPDVVLLDLGIPGIEGNKLLEMITGESPNTPVIIVSGRAEIDDAIAAFKAGAWDYITKPIVNMDMLEKTVRNCLELKSLKERVTIAESRYYNLVQSLPVVVFALNGKLELEFMNTTSTSVLGYPPEIALSEPGWLLANVHDSERHAVANAFVNAFANPNTPFFLEFQFKHKNGYPVQVQAKSINIIPPNDTTGSTGRMEGVLSDVTERAFLDKMLVQRAKLNTLGAMADEIAHEFRNPIFALGGFARRLQTKHPDITETEIILQEATRLEQLLDRVKEYLKPVTVNVAECSLNGILQFCAEIMRPKLARDRIVPQMDLCTDLSPLLSDHDLLTQIGINLITNAALQMAAGETITLRSFETPGQQHLTVCAPLHTNISLDREQMLMPFEEAGPSRGIAVAYRLAKDVGGLLGVEQENGVLTLKLSLPLQQ
ncbi:response regulator [Desulfovibrio mangrovi]|uniref:response regulator n=1 Tax=Desulfovibrio mangrovi TaxID=2976983 RepID=UPI0022482979|nr:response regulator [Desulfovibrio mangrovi]UZP66126.1 response regulator [Desulfovibrio mangrovi]